jgi:hypothetical protein
MEKQMFDKIIAFLEKDVGGGVKVWYVGAAVIGLAIVVSVVG